MGDGAKMWRNMALIWHLYGAYMVLVECLNLCMMAIFEEIDWNEKNVPDHG